jgi:hypothetical protein
MEQSQLQNLMSYTIFHIGAYISLAGAIIAAQFVGGLNFCIFRLTFICFLSAGVCGGIIASNIPEYSSFKQFKDDKIGFWGFKIFKYNTWATLEHVLFWGGVLNVALRFILFGVSAIKDTSYH